MLQQVHETLYASTNEPIRFFLQSPVTLFIRLCQSSMSRDKREKKMKSSRDMKCGCNVGQVGSDQLRRDVRALKKILCKCL